MFQTRKKMNQLLFLTIFANLFVFSLSSPVEEAANSSTSACRQFADSIRKSGAKATDVVVTDGKQLDRLTN